MLIVTITGTKCCTGHGLLCIEHAQSSFSFFHSRKYIYIFVDVSSIFFKSLNHASDSCLMFDYVLIINLLLIIIIIISPQSDHFFANSFHRRVSP